MVIQETLDDILCLHVKAQGACARIYMLRQIIFRSILLAADAREDRGNKPSILKNLNAAYDSDS